MLTDVFIKPIIIRHSECCSLGFMLWNNVRFWHGKYVWVYSFHWSTDRNVIVARPRFCGKEQRIKAFHGAQKNEKIQSEMHEINKIPINPSIIIQLGISSGCNPLVSAAGVHSESPSISQQNTSRFTLLLILPDSPLPQSKWLWLMAGSQTNNHVVFSL